MDSLVVIILLGITTAIAKVQLEKSLDKKSNKVSEHVEEELSMNEEDIIMLSKYFLIKLFIKMSCIHSSIFIACLTVSILNSNSKASTTNMVVAFVYILLWVMSVAYYVKEHRRNASNYSVIEYYFQKYDHKYLQSLVNMPEPPKKMHQFYNYYQELQNKKGLIIILMMVIQVLLSIYMWVHASGWWI
ncbi:hypothetical protein [Staphylococcus aureus]|uniref:hypothetical protein n=1 Tax=Staphylococcus aureus TaxID=1280 RepID=UPI000DE406AA|nr:hypothetical protein [Staphylococcus aureus]